MKTKKMKRFLSGVMLGVLLTFAVFAASCSAEPELHVFIAFGQSNMQGPSTIRQTDIDGVNERWQVMNVVAGRYAGVDQMQGQWYKAVPPLIIPDIDLPHWNGGTFTTGLGPSDHFGRTIAANTPDNITVGVIPVAHGALALVSFHRTLAESYFDGDYASPMEIQGWNRYRNAGYDSFYDAIIINARIAQEQGGIIKGIIVHQGESGLGGGVDGYWHDMLKEIYDDMLADLNLAPNSIPILLGQLWNGGTGPGGFLNTDNVLIQSVIPNAWVISSEGLTEGRVGLGQPDNIHFGSADIEGLGIRYAEKMLDLLYR